MSKEAKLQHDEKVAEVLHYFEKIREGIPEGLLETLAKGLVAQLEQIDRRPRPPAMRVHPAKLNRGYSGAEKDDRGISPKGHYGIGDVD